jgi:hypothetical protein
VNQKDKTKTKEYGGKQNNKKPSKRNKDKVRGMAGKNK